MIVNSDGCSARHRPSNERLLAKKEKLMVTIGTVQKQTLELDGNRSDASARVGGEGPKGARMCRALARLATALLFLGQWGAGSAWSDDVRLSPRPLAFEVNPGQADEQVKFLA